MHALDQWCLRRILNIHWTERITNNEVRSRTHCNNHYCLTQSAPDVFGSLITSAEDHSRALYASTTGLPKHGEDPAGRDIPGYELSRMIYGHSIWVWRQLNGVRRTEQLGMTLVETTTSLTSSG